MRVVSEHQFLQEVGVSLEKMPEPGKCPIHVSGEDVTVSYAIRALRILGYTVCPRRDDGAYELVVKEMRGETIFHRDWVKRYVQPDIDRIVRTYAGIGVGRREALFYLASACVRQQTEGGKKR